VKSELARVKSPLTTVLEREMDTELFSILAFPETTSVPTTVNEELVILMLLKLEMFVLIDILLFEILVILSVQVFDVFELHIIVQLISMHF